MTEVEDRRINYASVARFARESDPFSHESKRPVVAPKRAMYEIAQMYKLIRKDETLSVLPLIEMAALRGHHDEDSSIHVSRNDDHRRKD